MTSIPLGNSLTFDAVVALPRDDDADSVIDPTGNGAFHWVPLHDNGLRERMRQIVDWVVTVRPSVVVIDVSVEVAVLVRLLGVPVVVMAMPGQRTDAPHKMVYELADHIVAAWPGGLYEPAWMRPHRQKTSYVGGISRFGDRMRVCPATDDRPGVLAMFGAGGSAVDSASITQCMNELPEVQWSSLGLPGGRWVEDPWPELCAADIVIAHAGQSSVADIAAAGRSAIVIPQHRPFGEQHATAAVLAREGLATVEANWPAPSQWATLIDAARGDNGARWAHWQTRGAAGRAAAAIEKVADGRSISGAVR